LYRQVSTGLKQRFDDVLANSMDFEQKYTDMLDGQQVVGSRGLEQR
jgi:hypothetical protein